MQIWEYSEISLNLKDSEYRKRRVDTMEEKGQQGWECFAIKEDYNKKFKLQCFFKRPK